MSVVRALRLAEAVSTARTKRSPARQKAWQNVVGMEPRTLEYISIACGGELDEAHARILARRVCTDSRSLQAGDLFVALRGERFDGHDFVEEAAARGAAAVIVEPSALSQSLPCPKIVVADTRRALGRLGACYRTDFDFPIIAVAGSNGKTTTKEIIGSVLRERLNTLSSDASFNNDIGVPVSLLNINGGHEAAVIEIGTNHPGELAPLIHMVQPRFGVITSIGREHLEFFGGMAAVAEEEGWLAELLPAYGKLFLNGDSQWTLPIKNRCRGEVVQIGFEANNDWRIETAKTSETGTVFRLAAPRPDFTGEYHLQLFGRHQAINAVFGLALGAELGLSVKQCRRGLEKCKPARMRLQVWAHEGVHVLDDSYNANADSMLAALEVLNDFPCKGRRIAVFGDMAELGNYTADMHREIGRRSADFKITHLLAVGKSAQVTADAARDAGVPNVSAMTDIAAVMTRLKDLLRAGDAVLVKASRSAGLERITDALGRPGNDASKNHS